MAPPGVLAWRRLFDANLILRTLLKGILLSGMQLYYLSMNLRGSDSLTRCLCGVEHYSRVLNGCLQLAQRSTCAMTSEQAAQLIDDTLDLVHQRLLDLEASDASREQQALAEEFREWRQPHGGHIDLMVCPGFSAGK